jgi:hypothetical protein
MRINIHHYDRQQQNSRVQYWKKVIRSMMIEYNGSILSISDKGFRFWLIATWGIELKIRFKKLESWVDKSRYPGVSRLKYVHCVVLPKENLSMLLLKFPVASSDSVGNEEDGNNF